MTECNRAGIEKMIGFACIPKPAMEYGLTTEQKGQIEMRNRLFNRHIETSIILWDEMNRSSFLTWLAFRVFR